jgi:NAD(P)-dependent dehydrogenase (short-subunit alcohol dehydrogenase family)
VNYEGVLLMLKHLLPKLQAQALQSNNANDATRGRLSLVSSVAGYGGLPKSLAYGPTKAALTNLAEALYIDLRDDGIGVDVISPGFVETPLTAQNEFTMPALQTPEQAAQAIVAGWEAGEFEIHFPKRFTRFLKSLQLLGYGGYFKAVKRFTGL